MIHDATLQTVRVCSELFLRVVLGVCWGTILVNLHCSSGQVYKQALCVEFPSSVKSWLVENNTPRNHAPPDPWKDQLFLPHIHELVLREGPANVSVSWTQRPTDLSAGAAATSALRTVTMVMVILAQAFSYLLRVSATPSQVDNLCERTEVLAIVEFLNLEIDH